LKSQIERDWERRGDLEKTNSSTKLEWPWLEDMEGSEWIENIRRMAKRGKISDNQ
jgi:hypothetical protein